jgi:hypothetical protein
MTIAVIDQDEGPTFTTGANVNEFVSRVKAVINVCGFEIVRSLLQVEFLGVRVQHGLLSLLGWESRHP